MDTYKCLEHRGDMVALRLGRRGCRSAWPARAGLPLIETHNAHALAGEEDEFGRKNLPYIDTL